MEGAWLGEAQHERHLGQRHATVLHVAPCQSRARIVQDVAEGGVALLQATAERALARGHAPRDLADGRYTALERLRDELANAA